MYFTEIIGLATSTTAGKMSAAQCQAIAALGTAATHAATDFDAAGAAASAQSAAQASSCQKSENLADVASVSAARASLGLGTSATMNAGVANGVATLNASGQLASSEIPTSLVGAVDFQGTWNASTNNPTLASGVGTKGFYYLVSTAGATTLDGNSSWGVGDMALFDGSVWQRLVAPANQVSSFNGRQGAVTPQTGDYTAAQVGLGSVSNALQLVAANNLSDVNPATARGNLGLGSAATQASSAFDAAGSAATAQSNAEAYAANSSNQTSGTLAAARMQVATAAGASPHNGGALPDPGSTSHATPYLYGDNAAYNQLAAGSGVTISFVSGTFTISATGGGGGGGGATSAGTSGEIQYSDGAGNFLADVVTTDGAGNYAGFATVGMASGTSTLGAYADVSSTINIAPPLSVSNTLNIGSVTGGYVPGGTINIGCYGGTAGTAPEINIGTCSSSTGAPAVAIGYCNSGAAYGATVTIGDTNYNSTHGGIMCLCGRNDKLTFFGGTPAGQQSGGGFLTDETGGSPTPTLTFSTFSANTVSGTGDDTDINSNFNALIGSFASLVSCISSLAQQVNALTSLVKAYNLGS